MSLELHNFIWEEERLVQVETQPHHIEGWDNVQKSWSIIKPPISLFEHKLKRGDVVGAINLSIIETERAKQLAHSTIEQLTQNQKNLDSLANKTLVL